MTRLISPIARVQIGDDTFMSGDGKLLSCMVDLGEDDRASHCRFTLQDKGLLIAAKYFEMSFTQGGIQVPSDLLDDKSGGETGGAATPSSSNTSVVDASQTPEIKAWLDTIAHFEGTDNAKGYNTIVGYTYFQNFKDHPRAFNRQADSDAAGRYQFKSTTWDGLHLSDFSPANQDKGAVLLIQGRGVLDSAKQGVAGIHTTLEQISYEWASLPPQRYPGQGVATEAQVTDYYKKMLAKYKGQGNDSQAAAQQQPTSQDTADTSPQEVSQKGTEIIVELGYSFDNLIAYHFIHIGTDTSGRFQDKTEFTGQTVRWLMTRRVKNTAYANVTLKQVAEKIAKSHGLTLEMEGDGPVYQYLSQDGLTDYELLLREAREIGFTVQDSGTKLIIKPYRADFTGFVITPDILQEIKFTDKAQKNRTGTSTSSDSTLSGESKFAIDRITGVAKQVKFESSTAIGKAVTNQAKLGELTGKTAKVDLSGAIGSGSADLNDQPAPTSTTAPAKPVATPATAAQTKPQAADGVNAINSAGVGAIAQVAASIASGVGVKLQSAKPVATTGSPTKAVSGTPKPGSASTASATATPSAPVSSDPAQNNANQTTSPEGMPKQEAGIIALKDGRAEAQSLKKEKNRIEGYKSNATLIATPDTLTLAPGQIIGISAQCVPDVFAREWRLKSVKHELNGGKFSTEVEFYTPQAVVDESGTSSTPDQPAAATAPSGKMQNPLPGAARGTPFNPDGRYAIRRHMGIDLNSKLGGGGSILAAADGKVTSAGDLNDGYGNCVTIAHSGEWEGWETLYGHMVPGSLTVSNGSTVKKGQKIGVEGDSGISYGAHLHFEVHKGAAKQDPELYISPCPVGTYGEGANIKLKC